MFSQIACKQGTHLQFSSPWMIYWFKKVTILASWKKINFPTILEQAPLNENENDVIGKKTWGNFEEQGL